MWETLWQSVLYGTPLGLISLALGMLYVRLVYGPEQ